MATPKNGFTSNMKKTLPMSKRTGTSTSPTTHSPALEELKKDLFIALEVLDGYTEAEALLNYECEHGTCKCV